MHSIGCNPVYTLNSNQSTGPYQSIRIGSGRIHLLAQCNLLRSKTRGIVQPIHCWHAATHRGYNIQCVAEGQSCSPHSIHSLHRHQESSGSSPSRCTLAERTHHCKWLQSTSLNRHSIHLPALRWAITWNSRNRPRYPPIDSDYIHSHWWAAGSRPLPNILCTIRPIGFRSLSGPE